jgi:hypothetical protein
VLRTVLLCRIFKHIIILNPAEYAYCFWLSERSRSTPHYLFSFYSTFTVVLSKSFDTVLTDRSLSTTAVLNAKFDTTEEIADTPRGEHRVPVDSTVGQPSLS